MNTVKKEIRVVQYPSVISGNAVDHTGFFMVEFDRNGEPVRGDMLRLIGYDKLADLIEFYEQLESALFERETLHIHDAINLDEWGGTIYFPHLPILR